MFSLFSLHVCRIFVVTSPLLVLLSSSHTHTHTLSLSSSRSYALTHVLPHSLSLCVCLSLNLFLSPLSFFLSLSVCLSLSLFVIFFSPAVLHIIHNQPLSKFSLAAYCVLYSNTEYGSSAYLCSFFFVFFVFG
jgi:hypothetical protein